MKLEFRIYGVDFPISWIYFNVLIKFINNHISNEAGLLTFERTSQSSTHMFMLGEEQQA
jgi:hypothetical protein